jgi:hypothetical protein
VPGSGVDKRPWEVGHIELASVDLTRGLSEQTLPDLGYAGRFLQAAVRNRRTGSLIPDLDTILCQGPPVALAVRHLTVRPEWVPRGLYRPLLAETLAVFTPEARFAVIDPFVVPETQRRQIADLGASLEQAGFLPYDGLYLAPLRDPAYQQRAERLAAKWIHERLAEDT